MKLNLKTMLGICLVAGALLTATAVAQETTATIRGVVVDVTDATVADAKVEILDQRTGNLRTFTTN